MERVEVRGFLDSTTTPSTPVAVCAASGRAVLIISSSEVYDLATGKRHHGSGYYYPARAVVYVLTADDE